MSEAFCKLNPDPQAFAGQFSEFLKQFLTVVQEMTAGQMVRTNNLRKSSHLNKPDPVNVKYKNTFTEVDVPDVIRPMVAVDSNNQTEIQAYIDLQDSIRKISYKDYL